jgi:hypothetical protein
LLQKAVTLAIAGLPANVREQYSGLSDDHFLRILEKGISLKDYAEVLSTPEWKAAADKIVGISEAFKDFQNPFEGMGMAPLQEPQDGEYTC